MSNFTTEELARDLFNTYHEKTPQNWSEQTYSEQRKWLAVAEYIRYYLQPTCNCATV